MSNTYDFDTLLEIKTKIDGSKRISLKDEAITRIKGLLEESYTNVQQLYYINTNVIVESQNAYIPTHLKLNRQVTDENSLEVRREKARRSFNRLNLYNARSVAAEMVDYVDSSEISNIIFDAIYYLIDDNTEKNDQWNYWIKLLPEINKKKKDFQENICNKTMDEFNKLLQKYKYKFEETDMFNFQKIGCWISCLLATNFLSSKKYAQILHTVILNLKIPQSASVIYSSLIISGETIDKQNMTDCWFLFSFLVMNSNKCPSFLKFNIIDLFDLRKFDWNKQRFRDSLEHYQNLTSNRSQTKPVSWSTATNSLINNKQKSDLEFSQKEYWGSEFTSYKYHPEEYKVPLKHDSDPTLITKVLLSLLIKQKGRDINNFHSFTNKILTDIFKEDTNKFLLTMMSIKTEFRKLFEGEDESICIENHIRYYTVIAQFLINKWDNLYNYLQNIFDCYLNILVNNIKGKDQVILPQPSIFLESIIDISGTDEYLTPEQCIEICAKFPKGQAEFNSLVFKDKEYKIINKEKVKQDDFWSFLSQLAFCTNPDLINDYFSDTTKISKASFYEKLLYTYNKIYEVYKDEKFTANFYNKVYDQIKLILSDDNSNLNDYIRAALELLKKDDTIGETISDDEIKKVYQNFINNIIGTFN